MKYIVIILIALFMSACGGGSDSAETNTGMVWDQSNWDQKEWK